MSTNGMENYNGEYLDLDGDGVDDAIGYDTDGDGIIDTMELDTDLDGAIDALAYDTDGDGIFETAFYDTDGDGTMDSAIYDPEGDGVANEVAFDADKDGVMDAFGVDVNGDGTLDRIDYDLDADGTTDYTILDANGDGIMDTSGYTEDVVMEDSVNMSENTNDYSEADRVLAVEDVDADADGVFDSVAYYVDSNGDGVAEAIQIDVGSDGDIDNILYDGNGDGVFETEQYTYTVQDTEGNEFVVTDVFEYVDEDGDGQVDHIINLRDVNNDGTFDLQQEIDYATGAVLTVEYLTDDYLEFMQDVTPNYNENYDGNGENVVGDISDIENWEFQGETKSCALHAQRSVIEALTDEDIDMNEFVNKAEELGVYDGSGTTEEDMDAMLEAYGLETETSHGATVEDIVECLENGGKVIVGVDGNEIWYPDDSEAFLSNDPNHAIQVVGIDYSDPDNPIVIVNDSGTPNGDGMEIPLDVFVDAWEDSNCLLVEAYLA